MSNLNPSQLPAWTGNIDIANDVVMVWKNSNSTLYKATPNQLANLASQWVGINDTQTLTAKTLTAPAISAPVLSGTITGTYVIGGTPTFPASVVTLTGSQTLTNKIFTAPTITSPNITNASITADAVTGFTTANTGTIYGVSITAGTWSGAALTAGSVATAAIATGAITGPKLATGAIYLGSAQITSNLTTTSASPVQATGLTATVTIPTGGRNVKITVFASGLGISGAGQVAISIWDGVVGSGTQLAATSSTVSTSVVPAMVLALVNPAAGSKTYNVGFDASAGTGTIFAAGTTPTLLLVELC